MQLSVLEAFIALLCASILAQGTAGLAYPDSQPTPAPSQTSDSTATITNGPECTGCLLEAVNPTPLSYPGTVYCIDMYFILTVPSSIFYTSTMPDGCTSIIYRSYTASTGSISTTSITWSVSGTTLTWPTTYHAYNTFKAGTWSRGGDTDCTIHPQTVSAQSPIIYPASSFPGSLAPVPSEVVQSIIHDPSIQLPFNIATCTANGALPNRLRANLGPECSCTTESQPPPSCIQLPASTSTLPNPFTHSGYRQHQAATPLARRHMRRDVVSFTRSHTHTEQQGIINGGDYPSSGAMEGTDTPAMTSASSLPATTSSSSRSTPSPSLGSSSSTSSASLSSDSSASSPSIASGSSFVA